MTVNAEQARRIAESLAPRGGASGDAALIGAALVWGLSSIAESIGTGLDNLVRAINDMPSAAG